MRVTIIVPDNNVLIGGIVEEIDLTKFDPPEGLRAVQWNGETGWEEYEGCPNKEIDDLAAYQPIIDEWHRLRAEDEAREADPLYGLAGAERARRKFELAKEAADADLAAAIAEPVAVTIPEGTWRYNGGEASAAAIAGAVTLAEALGETIVTLWDADNVLHEMALDSAMAVAVAVAKTYRAAAYARAEAIAIARAEMEQEIANCHR